MSEAVATSRRVTVDGKFLRRGEARLFLQGVSYGPFRPHAEGEPFADPARTREDFLKARSLGANLIRIYDLPPVWLLELATELDLLLLVDVPWAKHLCFLDDPEVRHRAVRQVVEVALRCRDHACVVGISVVNEIPADIVRWSGGQEISSFLDHLIQEARSVAPDLLYTFSNFPPTEFLLPASIDFLAFNVFLHERERFESYLHRLQMIADHKPLVLTEIGMDALREGEARQAETLGWQLECASRAGLAGCVVFRLSDDWFRDGQEVEDWQFGLLDREGRARPAADVVRQRFQNAPSFPLNYTPRVSVVVAAYNARHHLPTCLKSLAELNYPDYEVIVVDDGSTDGTPELQKDYPGCRWLILPENGGLSAARNAGIQASNGEVVAFTDADCRADADWLFYLMGDLVNSTFIGMGGHNFLPPDDGWVAGAVMVSPGGPAHVMLTDRIAEHIPGCNMAFYKWALEEVGGFDPIFHLAGDDVDICWRLQQRGYRIGFSPAGFVWHYRRSNVRAYLRQQRGYGEAEALLVRKHPEHFNSIGGNLWRGRIYTPARTGLSLQPPIIYHGAFGSGFFQSIYHGQESMALVLLTSLEYHITVLLPMLVLGAVFPTLLPLSLLSLLIPLGLSALAGWQADLAPSSERLLSRPLVSLLFLLQPIIRGWARYRGRMHWGRPAQAAGEPSQFEAVASPVPELHFWSNGHVDRLRLLDRLLQELQEEGWPNRPDQGWSQFDVEVFGSRWCQLQVMTVSESHSGGRSCIRCRLKARWSLLARFLLGVGIALEILLLGILSPTLPWFVGLTFGLLGYAYWLRGRERELQLSLGRVLEKVAAEIGLIRLREPSHGAQPPSAPSNAQP